MVVVIVMSSEEGANIEDLIGECFAFVFVCAFAC